MRNEERGIGCNGAFPHSEFCILHSVGMMRRFEAGDHRMPDREREQSPSRAAARAAAPAHTTAAKLNKTYSAAAAVSDDPDKTPARTSDGGVNSANYAQHAGDRAPAVAGPSPGGNGQPAGAHDLLDVEFHHPLERWLARDFVRRLLAFISRARPGRQTIIEEVLTSYHNPEAPRSQRFKYWPLHKFIDRMRGSVSVATFRQRISEHTSTVRGLVATARSVAEFGLTVPQRFSAPLFAVWNFTQRCNLQCKHCYQDASHTAQASELTLAEKLDLIEQLAAEYVPMIAFAGGEPTISPDLLPVLQRCREHGVHTSVATNGSTMTPRLAGELAAAGARYVEISLDSVRPERHDAFRGQPGMWHRTVRGMRTVVQTPGLRLGIAMCVHQGNFDEVEDMIRFAQDIGASCLAHFNFIPVGRGLEMAEGDLTPAQREWLLRRLNDEMQAGRIGIISTAPQLGRVCLTHGGLEGRQSCSHAGSGGGIKAKVVAKYLGGCGAGRTYVCIEPSGDITPCVYMPQRVLGNIRTRRFRDIFRNNPYWELLCDRSHLTHHCEVCRFKNYCGGCRARADSYFGAVNAGDPGCLFNEKHWERLVATAAEGQVMKVATAAGQAPGPAPHVRLYDGTITHTTPQA
jgi:radical SAM protein with 4Fe4S-binding SPASM domain